ncbi:DUF523 domain-containing protein [Microbulbifer sp. ANSA005]|uniref:DUF523 domain-containing protein n=1 Tax=Microbulbifer sp. ANSA005 TaxID=3243362 RepID=UPI0040417B5F
MFSEVAVGLPVPRVPAEISGGRGAEVLAGSAKVLGINKEDLTEQFIRGAKRALQLCLQHNIKYAVLTENSPSCGSDYIYDGIFSGAKIVGSGVVSALRRREGIQVFNQNIVGRLRKLLEVSRDN